jgi:ATP-binding cassette subfamily B protein/subfamily B ATP-binding cassette protein MsbA
MTQSLIRLWPYIRPFRRDIIAMFLLGLFVTLFSGLVPVLVQVLLEIYNHTQMESLQRILPEWVLTRFPLNAENRLLVAHYMPFGFPIAFALLGLARFGHYAMLNYISERIIASIRMDLVRKILRLNLTFHGSLERGSGTLISRVFNDPVLLQQGLNFYVTLIREPIQGLVYLSYMIWLDWRLTLCSLVFMPFFIIITKGASRSLRKYGILGREAMEDLTAVFKDSLDGTRVVQSFNLESEMESRFQRTLDHYLMTARKIIMREQAVSPLNEFVISFLVMGFALYSINQVLNGDADSSKFIAFLAAAGFLQAPIKQLQDTGVKIQQTIVVVERLFEVIDSPLEVKEASQPLPFPHDWRRIQFRNVEFSYGGETVLKRINLTVNRGEVIALVGESGSGKSTLVNLLERFYDPTSGEITIDGVPIQNIGLKDLRHNIALVTQDVFLFRDSIARNIQAGDFAKGAAMPGRELLSEVEHAAQLANAKSFIDRMPQGFESPVGERGSFLSGGEKQRVSIARAIFKDAPILILDEATSALDSVSELEVQKGLQHLLANRTAFVIAHRLSTIFHANRILVLKKGEIVEDGDHATLLAKGGEYFGFYNLQMSHERAHEHRHERAASGGVATHDRAVDDIASPEKHQSST